MNASGSSTATMRAKSGRRPRCAGDGAAASRSIRLRTRLESFLSSWRFRRRFREMQTFCMFIGYPRSGHSIIAATLDAHPDIVISHELDVLGHVRAGVRPRRILGLALVQNQRFGRRGRRWQGYDYRVPGQWQGRFRRLRVIGDKKGGRTTRHLMSEPDLLDRVRADLGDADFRLIHVVRNPFDNIATLSRRHRLSIDDAIDDYFARCATVSETFERSEPEALVTIHHEDFVKRPQAKLSELCQSLNATSEPEHLEASSKVVFREPRRTRRLVRWSAGQRARIEAGIDRFGFLRRYRFSD